MNNFIFHNPTKIIFGKETIETVGEELKKYKTKKILLCYGKSSIFKNNVYNKVIASLTASGIDWVEMGGIKANPVLSKVMEGIKIAKEEKVDGILAVGGGSVIDSAKVIARGYYYAGNVWDLFEKKAVSEEALPVFSVLTISATGSEMNANAVLTNETENKKWPMPTNVNGYPKFSIIDPAVQISLPKSQMANGAADTLAHVFEWYFDGSGNNDLVDEFAEGIIRTMMKHSRILAKEPDNYKSRAQFAWCATNALNMLLQPGSKGGDWATHMIEHSVSAFYDIAHGAGLAILFPAWMKYVYKNDAEKFSRFADKIFGITEGTIDGKIDKIVYQLKEYFKEIGAPVSLSEVGVKESDLMPMAENATLRGNLGKLMQLDKNDVFEIYKLAF